MIWKFLMATILIIASGLLSTQNFAVTANHDLAAGLAEAPFITVVNPNTSDSNFEFSTNTALVGTRFNATVWVTEVSDLFAYQVNLIGDDTLLNITNAWNPTWDPAWVFYGHTVFQGGPTFYDADGDSGFERVLIAGTLSTDDSVTDGGLLVIIEFEILYVPPSRSSSCILNIDNADTLLLGALLDGNFPIVSSTKTNGYYEFASMDAHALVVRGLDDRIWYRTYNSSSHSWGNWNALPNGATCDSPAAAVFSGRLHVVVRGMDGYSLWFTSVNLTDESFAGWTGLSGAAESTPTLVSYEDGLVLVVRGLDNSVYYRFYNGASEVWEDWSAVPSGSTIDGPAATVADGALHIVVRGMDYYSFWHGNINMTTSEFSGWELVGGASESKPALAWCESRAELVLVVRGLDHVVYYDVWNGVVWKGWVGLSSGATCDGPAVTVMGDELHILVRGMDGFSLWHCYVDLATSDQSGWSEIRGATQSAPTLTS